MELYKNTPDEVFTLTIRRQGDKAINLTVWKCNREGCKNRLMGILGKELNPFATGKTTSIDIRHRIGGANMESDSISFKGLSPKETESLILKNL